MTDRRKALFNKAREFFCNGLLQEALSEIEEINALLNLGKKSDWVDAIDLHTLWGEVLLELGHYAEALAHGSKAHELLQGSTIETRKIGQTLCVMGRAKFHLGAINEARRFIEDSITFFRFMNDETQLLESVNTLAQINFSMGSWTEAVKYLKYGLEISEKLERENEVAIFSLNLGTLLQRFGHTSENWDEAEKLLTHALNVHERMGSAQEIAQDNISLGHLYLRRRQWQSAIKCLGIAGKISRQNSYPRELVLTLETLGELSFEKGEYQEALEHYSEALQIATKIAPEGDLPGEILRRQGETFLALGKLEEAQAKIEESSALTSKLCDRYEEAIAQRVMGLIRERKGDQDNALDYLNHGLHVLEELDERYEQARTLLALGKLEAENEDDEATRLLTRAESIFKGFNDFYHLGMVKLAMARVRMHELPEKSSDFLEDAENLFKTAKEDKALNEVDTLRDELGKVLVERTNVVREEQEFLERLNQAALDDLLKSIVQKVGAERGFICLNHSGDGIEIKRYRIDDRKARRFVKCITANGEEKPIIAHRSRIERDYPVLAKDRMPIDAFIAVPINGGHFYIDFKDGDRIFEWVDLVGLCAHFIAGRLAQKKLQEKVEALEIQVANRYDFHNIVGQSEEMRDVIQLVKELGDHSTSVLIEGETGVGKELVAKAIHHSGRRRNKPFVPVDCGAIPEDLFESELFGHKRGAFTGAIATVSGLIRGADGGTLFLDEITQLPLSLQAKLLRVLEDKVVRGIGETRGTKVDVRMIAATNKNLNQEMKAGRFRPDLYFRLSEFKVFIPPLRKRLEDIHALVDHFARHYADEYGKKIRGISPEALEALVSYSWPGNVRELRNVINRAVLKVVDGEVLTSEAFLKAMEEMTDGQEKGGEQTLREEVEVVEKKRILAELERQRWNKTRTAEALGLSRRGLRNKLGRYGIKVPK